MYTCKGGWLGMGMEIWRCFCFIHSFFFPPYFSFFFLLFFFLPPFLNYRYEEARKLLAEATKIPFRKLHHYSKVTSQNLLHKSLPLWLLRADLEVGCCLFVCSLFVVVVYCWLFVLLHLFIYFLIHPSPLSYLF